MRDDSVSNNNTNNDAHEPGETDEPSSRDAISKILQQAGKSAEEIASLATLDEADRSAEQQFSGEAPTIQSLFGNAKAREFHAGTFAPSKKVADVMGKSLDFLLKKKKVGELLDNKKMLFRDDIITGLAERGFFGLAIPQKYGGSGAKLGDLGPLLRALTFVHPDLAVMFEVHNFLGPVTPILDFGTEEQKQKYLPKMAAGELLGSFGLTEPGVGADPSKLSMTARLEGDKYIINGVKWPITNVIYGGICVLVVKLENHGLKPGRDSGMIIFELPKEDNENFRMLRNDLMAFDYLWNARFRLTNFEVPADRLLGGKGKGLAIAFSSLAKGRGGIGVNSAAKCFKLLAHLIADSGKHEDSKQPEASGSSDGGWLSFRTTFGKPIGTSPRIRAWVGKAACHGLAARDVGDLCFRLAANGVRDETQGMVAKVYATKALVQTAIHSYQIQGGRSVHSDELRRQSRMVTPDPRYATNTHAIENYIGENIHEFLIATVYEGPNPVLADVGAPNAMTRSVRAKYLEPIGLANVKGQVGMVPMIKFGWYIAKSIIGYYFSSIDMTGVDNLFPEKETYIKRALKRNRLLGRRLLFIIAKHQKRFMDQSFILGDEGGIFDQLCANFASLCFALSMDKPNKEYLMVAKTLDLESKLMMSGRSSSLELQQAWAEVGDLMMDKSSQLHKDLIADIEVSDIPLDPRYIDKYI
tara:strand:+ start:584 stop:2677 length:2094 start_codon:yes stop_codon:yes gene_type:complete